MKQMIKNNRTSAIPKELTRHFESKSFLSVFNLLFKFTFFFQQKKNFLSQRDDNIFTHDAAVVVNNNS